MVGFSYLRNPMIYLAKNIIESGQIGEIKTFSGVHLENYMQEHVPHSFRTRVKDGGRSSHGSRKSYSIYCPFSTRAY